MFHFHAGSIARQLALWMIGSIAAASEFHGSVTTHGLPVPGVAVTVVQGEKKVATTSDQSGAFAFTRWHLEARDRNGRLREARQRDRCCTECAVSEVRVEVPLGSGTHDQARRRPGRPGTSGANRRPRAAIGTRAEFDVPTSQRHSIGQLDRSGGKHGPPRRSDGLESELRQFLHRPGEHEQRARPGPDQRLGAPADAGWIPWAARAD